MARNNRNAAHLRQRLMRIPSRLLSATGKAITLTLSVLVVGGFIAVLTLLSHGGSANRTGADASGTPNPSLALTPTVTVNTAASCGTSTTPACPSSGGDWIPIASDTPAAVLTAFKQSGMYAAAQNSRATGVGDAQFDLSRPEAPVFERELHIPGGLIVPDVYVIPFDLPDGSVGAFAICNVDATHSAIEAGEIVPGILANGASRPHGQLTPVTANAAIAAVHTQRNVQLRAGLQPSFVFVEIDANLIETGQVNWSAPAGPQNPFWMVPGADGHEYLVDTAGKAHIESEIPIEMARPTPSA